MVRRYSDSWDLDDDAYGGPGTPYYGRNSPYGTPTEGGGGFGFSSPLGTKKPKNTFDLDKLLDIFRTEKHASYLPANGLPKMGGHRNLSTPDLPTKGGRLNQYSPELDGYQSNFAELLAQAMAAVGGGGGSGTGAVDNRIAAAKSANAESNARIQALYDSLGQNLKGAIPILERSVGAAQNAARAQTDKSQESMDASRDAARAAEAENLNNIGIGDSALLQAGRAQADADLQFDTDQLQQSAADQANYMANSLAADRAIQQGQVNGAAFAGTNAQVNNERTLQNMLAELEDERYAAQQAAAKDAQNSKMQAYQMALDMDNQNYNRFRDEQAYQLELDNTAYDRAYNEAMSNGDSGMDLDQMSLILRNIPENSPIRNMLVSQMLGMDPRLYDMINQPPVRRLGTKQR